MTTDQQLVDSGRLPGPAGTEHGAPEAWYVVYSKAHKERTAEFHLRRKRIEVFFPQLLLPSYVRARRRLVPLFPNYLLVRINLVERCHEVLWSPGVKRFVGVNGAPAPLGDDVVALLREHARPDGVVTARSTLKVGEEVEITSGPFSGIIGIIQRPPDAKGRIKVLMQLLNRQVVNVEVPLQFVNSQWAV